MKKIIILLVFYLIQENVFAQPQGINYQGVARDSIGHPLNNQNISLRLSILDSTSSGIAVYVETQNAMTNNSGLFNLTIGSGVSTTGIFGDINWGLNNKWLKVEMDAGGGSNYLLIGVTQFLSVPYAKYAQTAGGNLFNIGQQYGGGIIFYIDSSGQHGLICAPNNLGSAPWGCDGTFISGTTESIGTGEQNTNAIVTGCSELGIAAKLCSNLVLNGYDDWFLPSRFELNLIYKNLTDNGFGNLIVDVYWSSSQASSGNAFGTSFWIPDHDRFRSDLKTTNRMVQAIRKF